MSRSSKLALAVPPIFLLLGVALGGVSKAVTHDVGKGKQSMELQHLFDAELQYQLGMETVLPAESWEGDLIGSGEGRVTGARIRGTIRWSMYAASCPYRADGRQYPSTGRTDEGDHLCRATPRGFIKTDDGATIWFDAHGFGLRRENAKLASPHFPRRHGDPDGYLRRTVARAAFPSPRRAVCDDHARASTPLETSSACSNSTGGR